MSFNKPPRRWSSALTLGIGTLAAGGTAFLIALHPAAAASVLASATSAVTCAVTGANACVSGTNTSSGIGVLGASKSGYGVSGNSTSGFGVAGSSSSNYGVAGSSATSFGVFGSSGFGGAGVVGVTPGRYGVYGYTTNSSGGYGVYGSSGSGIGVYGTTTSGYGIGIIGYETAAGTGSYGYSASGLGTEGSTSSGDGLFGSAFGSGVAAYLTANTGYGLVAYSSGSDAIYAHNSNGDGLDAGGTYIGLIGRGPASGGYPIVLTDSSGNDLFWVTGAGDVYYKGGLHAFATTVGGGTTTAYSPKTTLPTVEDTGTAQLVGGAAIVRLDPAFAASIDPRATYRVFLTPNGDTHGLFVATKTTTGFLVRESQSGHSTVTFDYRIVATAVGEVGERMSAVTASTAIGPRAPLPVVQKIAPAGPITPAAALKLH